MNANSTDSPPIATEIISSRDLESCPDVVVRYLKKAGVIGSKRKSFAHILHGGEFRLKPKQRWFPIKGDYLFYPLAPGFVWKASIKVFPLFFISVKDEYQNGIGRSLVKLGSVIPIADQKGPEINESSLGRLLIEFIMIPTALVPSERLSWEIMDVTRARVVFRHNAIEVSAVFEFDASDLPIKTSIDRFGNFDGKMKKVPFVCDLSAYKLQEGLLIPTDIKGAWDLAGDLFYWFHFTINAVHFDRLPSRRSPKC